MLILACIFSRCGLLSLTSPSDNPLQTAVLNLFVSLKYRFPNLVVGSITRDSVKKALSNGISADQVAQRVFLYNGRDASTWCFPDNQLLN